MQLFVYVPIRMNVNQQKTKSIDNVSITVTIETLVEVHESKECELNFLLSNQ
jgi:hypothetical protein